MSNEWWRGGVIYQIYPRSFADSNHDGIGDLPGITAKLDYVASLGVDAIWISPFFASPMKDFGYDVSDYCNVDPMFGTLADFDALIAKADALGIKVMVDMVISHSSDQHAWFKQSRSSRDNAKADWYVWADPKPDGSPPNNWLSVFGGSAWEWNTTRRQYYLHNFLSCQPDLNFHNPEVQEAVLSACEFWLKRGVKGFRMDTANFYFHDQKLRDNPPNEGPPPENVPESNPYGMQEHLYDISQPENLVFFERLRALLDRYDSTASVGELGAKDALGMIGDYTQAGKRLHMVYTFSFLNDNFTPAFFRRTIDYLESCIGDGWPCWAFSNHDVRRAASRFAPDALDAGGRVLLALLGSLRGSLCLYQGEELGLPEADIAFEDLQDPYGIRFWPEFKGRDGCRTPMPWQAAEPNAGFSNVRPWLPVPPEHAARAVDVQANDPDSLLQFYRRFLAWRKNQPALLHGDIAFIEAGENILAITRSTTKQRLLCVFNLSDQHQTVRLEEAASLNAPLEMSGGATWTKEDIEMPSFSSFFGLLANR